MKCVSIQYGFRVNVQNVKIMHKQEVVGIANFIRKQLEEKVFYEKNNSNDFQDPEELEKISKERKALE